MQAVEREAHVGGELGVGGFVAEIVANVREPSVLGREFADESEGLVDGRMHGMRSVTKRVEDEMVEIAQKSFGGFRYGAEIREVGDGADAEAVHGERAVLGGNGNDACAEKFKGAIQWMKLNLRKRAFRGLRLKNVREGAAENREGFFRGINRDGGFLLLIERTNVVEAKNVVGVGVSVENGVEAIDILTQGLMAEIGRGVDDDVAAAVGKQYGRTSALVARVRGSTHFATTSQSWNAHRRAGAKNGES